MNNGTLRVLIFVTALNCAVASGAFFAFSSFVMRGLARLPAPQGVAAMQAINVAAVTPVFMAQLFGTALACLILIIIALLRPNNRGVVYLLTGAALYLIGTILVTIAGNVPLNDALAANNANTEGGIAWSQFVRQWTLWNHLRTIAALLASASLFLSLREE